MTVQTRYPASTTTHRGDQSLSGSSSDSAGSHSCWTDFGLSDVEETTVAPGRPAVDYEGEPVHPDGAISEIGDHEVSADAIEQCPMVHHGSRSEAFFGRIQGSDLLQSSKPMLLLISALCFGVFISSLVLAF